MHLKTEIFEKAVSRAATLYPTLDRVREVLIKADLPEGKIILLKTAEDMWSSAFSYADFHQQQEILLNALMDEYQGDSVLNEIKQQVINKNAFLKELSYEHLIEHPRSSQSCNTLLVYDIGDGKQHVDQLKLHLTLLEFNKVIALRDMHDASGGQDKAEYRAQQLRNADIILLCLTPAFFKTENQCLALTFAAVEMKKRIVPVLLHPCGWFRIEILAKIQALPQNGVFVSQWQPTDAGLENVIQGIDRLRKILKP